MLLQNFEMNRMKELIFKVTYKWFQLLEKENRVKLKW